MELNGIPKEEEDIKQVQKDIKTVVDALKSEWNTLPQFVDNMITDFPDYTALTPLLNPKDVSGPWGVKEIDMDRIITEIVDIWFNRINDEKNSFFFDKDAQPAYTKYKQNIKPALIEHISKYKDDLKNMNDLFENQSGLVINSKEKTFLMFLMWMCGDYLLFLEDKKDGKINNIHDFDDGMIPYQTVLDTWHEKLLPIYTEGRVQQANNAITQNFSPDYSILSEIINN